MILIADSGSTKTEWCIVNEKTGTPVQSIFTAGTNPYFQTSESIAEEIEGALCPAIAQYNSKIEAIYFYGAGCAFPEKNKIIADVLQHYIPAPVEVYSDLMAAARSLCKTNAGIACILGTGSNSCLFDGVEIIEHVSPLGFILGDEGSGAVLGKLLVGDCLKHQLPEALVKKFMKQYELTPELILERVYKQPFPNRFLATLSHFLLENITEQPIYNIVYSSFRNFFVRNVMQYDEYNKLPIHFTGSIAFYYKEILKEVALSLNLHLGNIEKAPMSGLISFHTHR
ncbi:ATPase [Parabacteroides bouchesdurhonensis]|uniref:ATPase n=1 Tax=Parabacteroides bouchesdurhonensis TaxID=1936995 RepID=UPI000C81A580|nr:ATPase [Parabacteroides bouchesdurhonensis]